jgi:hypothetical protein
MADFAIERFEVDVATDGQTYTLANDVGDVSRAFVRLITATDKSVGKTANTGNTEPNDSSVGITLTGTDELTFSIELATVKVIGEVWRYTGSPGGAYEFVVRQRGSVTVATGSQSNSVPVSGMMDRNDCIPFFNGKVSAQNNRSEFEKVTHYCYIDASSNIVFGKNNTGGTQPTTCYYEVVEFTGSAWSVGHGVSANHDTGNAYASGGETVTLNTDSTGAGGATFDVTDWATAMIVEATMGGDTAETGLSDCIAYVTAGGTTDTVRFTLDNSNSRNDSSGYIHVLKCDEFAVSRVQTFANISEGNGSWGTPLPMPAGVDASTPIEELALEWFPGTNGEGTAHLRGRLQAQIADNGGTLEIQHWVQRSGNNCRAAYAVVDFSACVDAGGGTTGRVKVWTGSAWEAKPVKVWTGSAWEAKPMKHWNGSDWVEATS